MGDKCNHSTVKKKNQLNQKKTVMQKNERQKSYKAHKKIAEGKNPLLISNYLKCKWIKM